MNTINTQKYKIELETKLLKTIFENSDAFTHITQLIRDENIFDLPEHRVIYADALKYFSSNNKAPDLVNIMEIQITTQNRASIKEYIQSTLSKSETEFREIGNLAGLIIDIKAETELRSYLKSLEVSGFDYISAISDKTNELCNKYLYGSKIARPNCKVAEEVLSQIMQGNNKNFIKTGFEIIDRSTNGIPKSQLTVIGARPGTGKTTFMLQLLRNLWSQNIRVGIFSLEMTVESLMKKNLSAITGIDSLRIESGNLSKQEKEIIRKALPQVTREDYVVVDQSEQTPTSIRTQINEWIVRDKVNIVLIDYLTLIKTNYNKSRNDLEVGRLSAELNSIAKTTGLPIVILSQLNRISDSRPDKRPQLSDLRESGSIEQDANMVLLLHWPDHSGIDPFKDNSLRCLTKDGEPLKPAEYFEVIIAKARNGRTGNTILRYRPEINTFESVSFSMNDND